MFWNFYLHCSNIHFWNIVVWCVSDVVLQDKKKKKGQLLFTCNGLSVCPFRIGFRSQDLKGSSSKIRSLLFPSVVLTMVKKLKLNTKTNFHFTCLTTSHKMSPNNLWRHKSCLPQGRPLLHFQCDLHFQEWMRKQPDSVRLRTHVILHPKEQKEKHIFGSRGTLNTFTLRQT